MKTMFLNQSKAVAKGLLIVLMATFGPNAVLAQDAAAVGSPEKVAVLDMAAALFNSDRAKALEQQIQQQTADVVAAFEAARGAFQVLEWLARLAKPLMWLGAAIAAGAAVWQNWRHPNG